MDPPSESLNALYAVFEAYPRPTSFLACGCCWKGQPLSEDGWRETDRPIVRVAAPGGAQSLALVSADDVSIIATDVPLTGGDLSVLKHYLPRLCELAVRDGFKDEYPDLSVVLSRLSDDADVGGQPWWEWPSDEQRAIHEFLDALWIERRRAGPDIAAEVLCAIANATPNLKEYLESWAADRDPLAEGSMRGVLAEPDLLDSLVGESAWTSKYQPQRANREVAIAWLQSQQ